MKKIQTVKKWDFVEKGWKETEKESDMKVIGRVLTATAPVLITILPKAVAAATLDGPFGNIHEAIMNGVDAGVVIVIIFAGCCWGIGHRSKAIEILIGVCCGYILARHAVDIRDFLKEKI